MAEPALCAGPPPAGGLAPQARQPMVRGWEGAEYALVWDGALTNGPELRRELAEAGFPLDSHDDTETLLAACILWGVETPRRLRGSFAYAFWDGGPGGSSAAGTGWEDGLCSGPGWTAPFSLLPSSGPCSVSPVWPLG